MSIFTVDSCMIILLIYVFFMYMKLFVHTVVYFSEASAFSSGLLIINRDLEKVTAGFPCVTVAMTTPIHIELVLIGWWGRGRAAEL